MARSLTHNPTSFDKLDIYLDIVTKEINESREITGFLLIQSLIESYLREWFLLNGTVPKGDVKYMLLKDFERISLKHIIVMHVILGNIEPQLFSQVNQLLNLRNEIAHELATVPLDNFANKAKISNATMRACKVCKEIYERYKVAVEKKTQRII